MEDILRRAKKHCKNLLIRTRCKILPFHNGEHTMEVYKNVLKIGVYEQIEIQELEPVLMAALFHDVGNAVDFKNHENFSVNWAVSFLMKHHYPLHKISLVIKYILATKIPQKPCTIYEEIICDADLFHLGARSYMIKNKLLRAEWAEYLDLEYSDKEWDELNIKFLEKHRFHTNYGKDMLEPLKRENLKKLKKHYKKFRKDQLNISKKIIP